MQSQYWDDELVSDRLNDIEEKSDSKIYELIVDRIKDLAMNDRTLKSLFQELKYSFESEKRNASGMEDSLLCDDMNCANLDIEIEDDSSPNKVKSENSINL